MYDLSAVLLQHGSKIAYASFNPIEGTAEFWGYCRTRDFRIARERDKDPEQALARAIVTALAPPPKRLPAPPKPILPLHDNEDTAYEDLLGDDEEEDLLG